MVKAGHGCGVFSSDDGICNMHCKTEVSKINANTGEKMVPCGGNCQGWLRATCVCLYGSAC
jgi:hypothetical protein